MSAAADESTVNMLMKGLSSIFCIKIQGWKYFDLQLVQRPEITRIHWQRQNRSMRHLAELLMRYFAANQESRLKIWPWSDRAVIWLLAIVLNLQSSPACRQTGDRFSWLVLGRLLPADGCRQLVKVELLSVQEGATRALSIPVGLLPYRWLAYESSFALLVWILIWLAYNLSFANSPVDISEAVNVAKEVKCGS